MNNINVSNLLTYPIKSTKGISLQESEVGLLGLKYDRTYAIINSKNHIITGRSRDNSNILKISTEIKEDILQLTASQHETMHIDLKTVFANGREEVFIFNKPAKAITSSHEINKWLSAVLEEECRLVKIDQNEMRPFKIKYGGRGNDSIAFSDAAPILLFSEASLNHLNNQIERPVSLLNFRPNIVVSGCEAYAEDTWKKIRIGECEFSVGAPAGRCDFITVDPYTFLRDAEQEPLRTLAKTRTENNKVKFGMYLNPIKLGTIKVGDQIEIEI